MPSSGSSHLDSIAENYVKLVLSVGQHDENYVDAFYGAPPVLDAVKKEKMTLPDISASGEKSLDQLNSSGPSDEMSRLRHQYLKGQLKSLLARVEMLRGKTFTFDQEATALYDVFVPRNKESHFKTIVSEIDSLLPGKEAEVSARYERYKEEFIIPRKRLDAVFQAAIVECRRKSKEHIDLPTGESFNIEYVNDKPWSAYNWYKGNGFSLIQMNTDLPIYIDRAVDLAAHEGYPGHHVYNSMLEARLYRALGWVEFSVYALFSPQSLIAEGTANFGIEVVFPGKERLDFEKNVLFPLAGIGAEKADRYYEIHALFMKLAYAGNEAARGYLDRTMTRDEAVDWLINYALMSRERASQRIRFFDSYRSYVINYNLGQDLVRSYIEKRGGTPENPAKRWEEFRELISSPRLPSGLC